MRVITIILPHPTDRNAALDGGDSVPNLMQVRFDKDGKNPVLWVKDVDGRFAEAGPVLVEVD